MKSLSRFAMAAAAILAACGDISGAGSGEKHSPTPQQRADAQSSGSSIMAYSEYLVSSEGWLLEADLRMASISIDTNGTVTVQDLGKVPYSDYGFTPAWSPNNTQLAFVDWGGTIEVYDFATKTLRYLTSGWSPIWSPDGTKIAYGAQLLSPTTSAIYVMNSDGTGVPTLVTSNYGGAYDGKIDWSPDGSTLAFDCCDPSGGECQTSRYPYNYPQVCTITIDGSGSATGPVVPLTTNNNPGQYLSPAWSPDGTQIAFSPSTLVYGLYWVSGLEIMDANGDNRHALPNTSGANYPTWSPDGSYIAFAETGGDGLSSIYSIKADGTDSPTLISLPIPDGYSGVGSPAWSRSSAAPAPPPQDQPPVASFTASCSDLACTFDSGGSTDDHGIASRLWDFGDGATAGDVVVAHSYAAAGTYKVTLTVIDTAGQSATATQTVTVTAPVDQPPVAQFTWSCDGLACTFDSSRSTDDVGIVARSWAFGDGATAGDLVAPSHTYAQAGTYEVTLTVTDGAGQSAPATHSLTVFDAAPVASFTYACAGTVCAFDATSSKDDVGIVSYFWNLGKNAGTASGPIVTKDYRHRGSWTVTLTVTDNFGLASSSSQTVTIR